MTELNIRHTSAAVTVPHCTPKPTSALVHDHEHPIASQHVSVGTRLATRNVAESWIQRENCQTDTLLHWVLALPLAMMRPQAQFPSITGMASSQR